MSAAGYKVSANYIEALVLSRPHTNAPAPEADVDCHSCKFGEQCRPTSYIPPCYNNGPNSPAEAAKAERERVLDAIQDHNDGRLGGMDILFATPANERTESAQDAYLKEAYFELTLVKHLIESLRQPEPQQEGRR
jgi:hypothetical protein